MKNCMMNMLDLTTVSGIDAWSATLVLDILMCCLGRRVDVIARLRGRPPTPLDQPPPESSTSSYPPRVNSDTREHRWRTVESWK